MNNKKMFLIIFTILLSSVLFQPNALKAEENQKYNYKPKEGYIPNEETAIKIAVAVWIPIYGKETIEKEKPYKAVLKDEIWYVEGSLEEKYELGGVAEAEISKDDGRIIRVSHGE